MFKQIEDNTYVFKANNKTYEIFFADDNSGIELYEENDPSTGFFFNDLKQLILFVNNLTDVVDSKID
jgi:hypothetical protein